ncbi:TPA: hypothetical protein I7730_14360 [Vibrio vulnificus]|uniref:Uncharacterized protein n=1 Tax=Vibrio vulnificus TaxID=672 RepID=A0A8H9TG89_VIBVL|nr:hypothetical protein [Vibrio vulnificus]
MQRRYPYIASEVRKLLKLAEGVVNESQKRIHDDAAFMLSQKLGISIHLARAAVRREVSTSNSDLVAGYSDISSRLLDLEIELASSKKGIVQLSERSHQLISSFVGSYLN